MDEMLVLLEVGQRVRHLTKWLTGTIESVDLNPGAMFGPAVSYKVQWDDNSQPEPFTDPTEVTPID
ncbi:hypothetical protein [Zavarzinella formosa]|uniref:hypothetical protein n=1 Tax=Zavarzinella formosa TaxID=360055 RepID=UPI0002E64EE1|nr:hypothetical protein [Zavarzinella formosa]